MKLYKVLLYMSISALLALLGGCNATQTPVVHNRNPGANSNFINPDIRGTSGISSRSSGRRVALVIGNGAYENESFLANPPNDAIAVGNRLKELGFNPVTIKLNLKRKPMRTAIADFGRNAANADAALFFYAGHAVQNHNQNFLLPIDITTNSIDDVTDQAINLSYPLAELRRARSKVNIVILDACRTPQFTNRFRGNARIRGEPEPFLGLARIRTQPDTMIVYATEPGKGAVDSVGGQNSPFTTGLLLALRSRDLSLGGVLRTTSEHVVRLTKGYQVPYTDGPRILDNFQFAGAKYQSVAVTPTTPVIPSVPTSTAPQPVPTPSVSSSPMQASPMQVSPEQTVISSTTTVQTQATQAERARIAALAAQRRQEEARIAELEREREAAEEATKRAKAKAAQLAQQKREQDAEAKRLAALESKRKAEEARIARLRQQRAEAERAAQQAKAEAARLARLNAEREAAARREAAKRAEARRRSRKAFEPEMVSIPAGCFMMGSPKSEKGRSSDEGPLHRVCVKAFKMGKYEITTAEYAVFLNARRPSTADSEKWVETEAEDSLSNHLIERNGRFQAEAGYERYPVNNVSWYGAVAYLQWLSQKTGKQYRLPTEAEWEYAARGGTQTRYWWGDEDPVCQKGARNGAKFDDNAQCDDTGTVCQKVARNGAKFGSCSGYTEAVGSYQANQYGLYDVHGNLWEWTCSGWSNPYDGSEKKCLLSGASARVFRGGSWDSYAASVRAANRRRYEPGAQNNFVGFRACEAQVK